jgi:hypothetical protein
VRGVTAVAGRRRGYWALVALLLLLGAWLRLHALTRWDIWYDECFSIVRVRMLERTLRENIYDLHPPLYMLVLSGWMALWGISLFQLRFFSALLGWLTLIPVWRCGRLLGGERAGVAALALFAVAPFQVYYSQEGRMYSLLMFFGAMAVLHHLRLLVHGRPRDGVAYVLWCIAMEYTHLCALLFIASLFVAGWVSGRVRRVGRLRWVALHALIALAFLGWVPQLLALARETSREVTTIETAPVAPGTFLDFFHFFVNGYSAPPDLSWLTNIVFLLLVVLGVVSAGSPSFPRGAGRWLGVMVVLPVFLAAVVSVWQPISLVRYHILAGGMVLLAAGVAVRGIPRRSWQVAAVLAPMLLVLPNLSYQYRNLMPYQILHKDRFYPTTSRRPFLAVSNYIERYAAPDALIGHFTTASIQPCRFYDRRGLEHRVVTLHPEVLDERAFEKMERAVGHVPVHLRSAPAGRSEFWLVFHRWGVKPDRDVPYYELIDWADQHAQLIRSRDFLDVHVRQYRWDPSPEPVTGKIRVLDRFGASEALLVPEPDGAPALVLPEPAAADLLAGPQGGAGCGFTAEPLELHVAPERPLAAQAAVVRGLDGRRLRLGTPWRDPATGLVRADWWLSNAGERTVLYSCWVGQVTARLEAEAMRTVGERPYWWPGRWPFADVPPWGGRKIATTDAGLARAAGPVTLEGWAELPPGTYDAFVTATIAPPGRILDRADLRLVVGDRELARLNLVREYVPFVTDTMYAGTFQVEEPGRTRVRLQALNPGGLFNAWADVDRIELLRRPAAGQFLEAESLVRADPESGWFVNPEALFPPHSGGEAVSALLNEETPALTLRAEIELPEGAHELWLRTIAIPEGNNPNRAVLELELDGELLAVVDARQHVPGTCYRWIRAGALQGPGRRELRITARLPDGLPEAYADLDVLALLPLREAVPPAGPEVLAAPHYGYIRHQALPLAAGAHRRITEPPLRLAPGETLFIDVSSMDRREFATLYARAPGGA